MDINPVNTAGNAGISLGSRLIPVPGSISPAAQATLAMPRPPALPFPPLADKAGWHDYVRTVNEGFAAMMRAPMLALQAQVTEETIAGVAVFVAIPQNIPAQNQDKAVLYLHGGGLVILGGECVGLFARFEATARRSKVFAVDYRNPLDHPSPAALEDCVAVYRGLLQTYAPGQIVITGVSGGGNLAAAMTLKLRDLGLPLPSAVGLFTPEVDLTESGDTFNTNRDIDVVLKTGLPEMNQLYAGGHDLADPYLSPLFGDFTKGFPPTFIQTGTRDLFLSNSVRMHRTLRQARIEAELHVWEARPHGGFGNAPEDREIGAEFAQFLAKHAGWAGP